MHSAAAVDLRTLILVVEDDAQTRELYRTALQNNGYAVVALEDGLNALRFFETDTPSAVVLDLGLPRLHGRDVYREMKTQGLAHHVPVVVVTGETGAWINDEDFACVLRKPVDPERLLEAVQQCIRDNAKRSRSSSV